jgi:hypothetical protein
MVADGQIANECSNLGDHHGPVAIVESSALGARLGPHCHRWSDIIGGQRLRYQNRLVPPYRMLGNGPARLVFCGWPDAVSLTLCNGRCKLGIGAGLI